MKDNETNVILNVHMKAVPGQEEKLFSLLMDLVEPTRAEPGCMIYELHRNPQDAGRFMFYERFVNQEALDFHTSTPHLARFRALRGEALESQVIEKWKAVA